MTRARPFGVPILRGDLAARLVRANPAPVNTPPPIEWRKFALNGYPASAQFQNKLNEAANQAVTLMPRQLFFVAGRNSGVVSSTPSERARYRFAFRTGPYHHQLLAFVTMQPPGVAYGGYASYARLKIFSDTAEATAVATVDFYYGPNPGGVDYVCTGWNYAKTVTLPVDGLSANTNYYACFYDELGVRIQTATVIELQSMTQSNSGYLPQSITNDSEVVSTYRANVAAIQKATWKSCGATLLNWTVDDGTVPLTTTSATATNVIDNSSTTISASTPGFTWDLTGSDRISQGGVIPCVMNVFASFSSAALNGAVYLKDSSGATVTSITGAWSSGTGAHWESVAFDLPASADKYDLMFARPSSPGTFSLHSVSIYPYES
jgi:hypothetical protein